ncbi:PREDICTED: nuclear pore complex protein NUP214 isoform X2 [Populus euphratica]|uniref:Nuclear pore complex protein NUP214 isoform X2 n=1 Tax=Populus euphratica TaxID=75702 RepID=A0AAJ6UA48_POPEU|nr:PREDICTED: nuclear pore complex protein NUP214 isoform X2 [Populus euphratica]
MGFGKEGETKTEFEEEKEGDHVESSDYYFDKIGKPIPILSDQTVSPFPLQNPPLPSRPLALSQYHRLIFIAHPSGFLVARTQDVMDAAMDIKEKGSSSSSSIQRVSLVDVPIGKVHILTLSTDCSTLAVSVAAYIHFFHVHSLLDMEQKPSFSCALSEPSSSTVKDIQWRRRPDNSYLVLSNQGKLYYGDLPAGTHTLKHVTDNVDAVEWSLKGKYIAVARGSIISILSSNFKERFSISLPFRSWIADSDDNCTVKVDSIRWVRHDSIIVGCFQQTADGKEENYLLQVISRKDGKIYDSSSKPVVLSFYDLFSGLVDDIVPYGSGPYLSLDYLEQCELAITANKKNTDQHIVLLGWSVEDEMSETAVIDIERDTWLPRIELQENGDDNLIMGLCVDKVSLYGKVKVEVGVEEQKELSPFCVLMCVTLEGKLVMFRVASATGANIRPEVDSSLEDEKEDIALEHEGCDQSNLSSGLHEQTLENISLGLQPQHVSNKELQLNKDGGIPTQKDLVPSDKNEIPEKLEIKSLSVQQSVKLGQSSLKASFPEIPSYLGSDSSKTETQKLAGFASRSTLSGKVLTDAPSISSRKDLPNNADLFKAPPREVGSNALPGVPSQSWSSGKVTLSASTLIQGNRPDYNNVQVGAANVPSDLGSKSFCMKDTAGQSTSVNTSVRPALDREQRGSIVSGTIESLPTFRSSQLSSHENFASARSPNHRLKYSKDNYKTSSLRSSEPNLSKQFGNIKELAKELDTLLECIEEKGGFRDACTVFLRDSVEALEEGMGTLSENCRMLKSVMDERLGEIHHLLDKTVQVLARKIYVDGIVKQASDSQYLELWNHQKLSSELELKRRCILKLNQELTNQLIQLERHFNALELQSFGGNAGFHTDRRTLQIRYMPSRQLQHLHSLQNTMSSQLAAAEQLSECLSKQMSMLSLESPVRQKNVKKELFETIGIPYDASFSSPDAMKVGDTTSLKKLLLSSGSAATKGKSRRHQSSAMKSSDSETSRRRRDSLDQSWASFEPTKTTVKRVLLQENQKKNVNKSLSLKDRQIFSSGLGDISTVHQEDQTSRSLLHPMESKGLHYGSPKQTFEKKPTVPFKWATDPPMSSQPLGSHSPILQNNDVAMVSVLSSLVSLPGGEISSRESYNMTADKSKSMFSQIEKPDSVSTNETRCIQQTETNINKNSADSAMPPMQTPLFPKKPDEIPVSTTSSVLAKSAMQSVKPGPADTKSSFFKSPNKNYEHPLSLLGTSSMAPTQPGKVPEINFATSKSQPSEKVSSSPSAFMSHSVSSSLMSNVSPNISSSISTPMLSAAMLLSTSLTSPKAPRTVLPSHAPPPTSEVSPELQPPLGKTLPSSNPSPSCLTSESLETDIQPLIGKPARNVNPTPTPSVSESLETEPQPPAGKNPPSVTPVTPSESDSSKTEVPHPPGEASSKSDVDVPTTAPQPNPSTFGLKLEPSASSVLTTGLSTGFAPVNQPSLNHSGSTESKAALNSQPQQPSSHNVPFGAPNLTSDSVSGKNGSLDVAVTEEVEMEEEAPEASCTNELNLGNLGGFGIGSTPIPTAPRANPFGSPFGSTGSNVASSSLTMTVPSGELFRPASFNFQSPQPSQKPPPTNMGAFSGGFGTGAVAQAPAQSQFGQPAHIGSGQQALESVLGTFGQSRQFGTGLPGSGFPSTSGFGGGLATSSSAGGFASAATAGGFAGVASTGGGFAALASSGTGFAGVAAGGGFGSVAPGVGFGGVASGGSGIAGVASGGGGFAAAASSAGGFAAVPASGSGFGASGSGFGAFGSQQGTGGFSGFPGNAGGSQQGIGGFSTFSGNPAGTGKPVELFTQMRK